MDNLTIYNLVRVVPEEAKKKITGGRLNGYTDINPMWRIKALTETFGVVGIGWYPEIVDRWIQEGSGGTSTANVQINLYVKYDGEWSKPIPGIGGSMFVASEKTGLYTSDECFKMAYTDAISVACKAIGIGADVYWEKDSTKYNTEPHGTAPQPAPTITPAPVKTPTQPTAEKPADPSLASDAQRKMLFAVSKNEGLTEEEYKGVVARYGYTSSKDIKKDDVNKILIEVKAFKKVGSELEPITENELPF